MPRKKTPVLRDLASNRLFRTGIVALAVGAFGFYLLFDSVLMPAYTRQDAVVHIPDLAELTLEEARDALEGEGFVMGDHLERFDRVRPLNRILDQNPAAGTPVKPGRSVYVTVNSRELPTVVVPGVEGLSLRGARNRLTAAGLTIGAEVPDSLPSPYRNAITRQVPDAGTEVKQGDGVLLWYGTGLGGTTVTVPDVVGLTASAAQELLLAERLRSVVLDLDGEEEDPVVVRQSRGPGVRVSEGFEIRLFTKER